jgi:hypothetical protein
VNRHVNARKQLLPQVQHAPSFTNDGLRGGLLLLHVVLTSRNDAACGRALDTLLLAWHTLVPLKLETL